ncbi:hypothetical protein Pdw03_4553 [Penicillium digitatum]|uniref:Uncharacterized protein n=1 Tax=Penicillium digitatum TaxID=36651 RepID=A0A7T6XID1_PENDI|nr:hypothetical protein Pdw03_4553 [Penicillium digitatum]
MKTINPLIGPREDFPSTPKLPYSHCTPVTTNSCAHLQGVFYQYAPNTPVPSAPCLSLLDCAGFIRPFIPLILSRYCISSTALSPFIPVTNTSAIGRIDFVEPVRAAVIGKKIEVIVIDSINHVSTSLKDSP